MTHVPTKRQEQVAGGVVQAVQLLEGLSVEDCHAVVRVLVSKVRVLGGALEHHGDAVNVRRHGLLMEASRQLEGADDCLREALRRD